MVHITSYQYLANLPTINERLGMGKQLFLRLIHRTFIDCFCFITLSMRLGVCALLLFTFLLGTKAIAADFYVVKDCQFNGNGSSWSCASSQGGAGAFNELPKPGTQYACGYDAGTWTLGATYYIAGSETVYRGTCIGRNKTGSGVITIKKATISDHGTDIGWQTKYGTLQAVLGTLSLDASMITGVSITGGSRDGLRSGYGFKFVGAVGNNTADILGNSNLSVEYVEMTSPNTPIMDNCIDLALCTSRAISTGGSNISVSKSYIHDIATPFLFVGASNVTISDCIVERNDSVSAHHSEGIAINGGSTNMTIKNNIWIDIEGTAFFSFMNQGTHKNINIYNNLSYYTNNATQTGVGNGWFTCTNTGTVCEDVNIYNNTLINLYGLSSSVNLGAGGAASNWKVKNNLWWCSGQCAPAYNTSSNEITYDKNWYGGIKYNTSENNAINGGTFNPFQNAQSYDYSLASNSTALLVGINLGEPFNYDFLYYLRPTNGPWYVGAYGMKSSSQLTPPPVVRVLN
jgi:hypothetical protein